MANLRDYFFSDLDAIINTSEFAEMVEINGKEVKVTIDEERLKERTQTEYGGMTTGMILYFVPVVSFSEKPKPGATQIFNKRLMYIEDVKENCGLYEIILKQNRSD